VLANKGALLRDGRKVFFNASLTRSRVLLIVGELAEDSSRFNAGQLSKCRGSVCLVNCASGDS
jgi:hypothetical protein